MCTRPRFFKNRFGFIKAIPCKCCCECRIMRVQDFTSRLKFELQSYSYVASFVTLTYSDDNLVKLLPEGSAIVGKYFGSVPPCNGSTLYRPDLSQFCDKIQKRLKRKYGKSGKYIGFGDYGSDTHRPHYHLLYIGLPSDSRRLVYDTWNKGNIDIDTMGSGCIRYVLDYIQSMPLSSIQKYEQFGDFEPPFYHFSKGLGFEYIQKNIDKFNKSGELVFGESGKKVVLNPYLKDKYGFISCNDYYPKSVQKYAKDHHLSLENALKEYCEQKELSYQKKLVSKGKPLYNVDNIEKARADSEFYANYGIYPNNIT